MNGPKQSVVINANTTLTLQGLRKVGQYKLKVTQDGTGSRTIGLSGTSVTWAGGSPPAALGANAVMFVDVYYDGSTAWGSWTPW
jgi:hypothetical protein